MSDTNIDTNNNNLVNTENTTEPHTIQQQSSIETTQQTQQDDNPLLNTSTAELQHNTNDVPMKTNDTTEDTNINDTVNTTNTNTDPVSGNQANNNNHNTSNIEPSTTTERSELHRTKQQQTNGDDNQHDNTTEQQDNGNDDDEQREQSEETKPVKQERGRQSRATIDSTNIDNSNRRLSQRERKSVVRLQDEANDNNDEDIRIISLEGEGEQLGTIQYIDEQINKHKAVDLKPFYAVLYPHVRGMLHLTTIQQQLI